MENVLEKDKCMPRVCLLLDVVDAQGVSDAFRKREILPHVYQSLDEFWFGSMDTPIDICIADINKFKNAKLYLKDHPSVVNEKTFVSAYISKDSYQSLNLLNVGFHLGAIYKEVDLLKQVNILLYSWGKYNGLIDNLLKIDRRSNKIERSMDQTILNLTNLKEKEYYNQVLRSLCTHIKEQIEREDFIYSIAKAINGFKDFTKFTILELSSNKKKLVSPKLSFSKYRHLPPLWLGESPLNGIEPFAQNMANQVCIDIVGGDLVSILIHGNCKHPDYILFISPSDSKMLHDFDWDFLEVFLSGIYGKFCYKKNVLSIDKGIITTWELFDMFDKSKHAKRDDRWGLINIDFSLLIDFILKRGDQFYWNLFLNDFFEKLSGKLNTTYKVCNVDACNVGICVNGETVGGSFEIIRKFALDFSYWRYFEDPDPMISVDIRPYITMIPFSAKAYWDYINKEKMQPKTSSNLDKSLFNRPRI